MVASRRRTTSTLLVGLLAVLSCARMARAENILAQISVPSHHLPHRYYGQVYQFPDSVRDYTEDSLFGYSFREDLPSGAVRELQIGRLRSRGAYLLATDLFANGRFSTMSHTVLMIFPRFAANGRELYQVAEDISGDLRITAPDGSILLIDGRTGALRPTRDFFIAPQGAPGTPPGFRHRGLHLEIHSTGRNPFLRGTPVTIVDGVGWTCRLSTDELFRYASGPESDVFRFDEDAAFFAYLSGRCAGLHLPLPARGLARVQAVATEEHVPILIPASGSPQAALHSGNRLPPAGSQASGTVPFLWKLFSN